MSKEAGWRFDNAYSRLPAVFFSAVKPTPVVAPRLVMLNRSLSQALGLSQEVLTSEKGVAVLAGNHVPRGAFALAQAYAGHQFGHFTMLGDGRAVVLGEHRCPDGRRLDIQLKGCGKTPYSRDGDGRAALGPMLREYIISEAMHHLGIPTTRSLAVVATGETVRRETALPGAVLTRVAASHVRVGTFEYAAAFAAPDDLRRLADYAIARHYPDCAQQDDPYAAFLAAVVDTQARLISRWMEVGFIHGVMNTDNMAISGQTIDYGPCAFMDAYDPATVFSSIDRQGRYAYANQPAIAQWNLAVFAQTLLGLLHDNARRSLEIAQAQIERFGTQYRAFYLDAMRGKLGLFNAETEDADLIDALLSLMREQRVDFTAAFRDLSAADARLPRAFPATLRGRGAPGSFIDWLRRWQSRLGRQPQPAAEAYALMRQRNPGVIARNHHVEAALTAAVRDDDIRPLEKLLAAVSDPYGEAADTTEYRDPPEHPDPAYRTFCGT